MKCNPLGFHTMGAKYMYLVKSFLKTVEYKLILTYFDRLFSRVFLLVYQFLGQTSVHFWKFL